MTPERAGIVHSILEPTPERAAAALAAAPAGIAFAEIRADHLSAADAAALVGRSPVPAIVTVRGTADGGAFDGSAHEKRAILEAALAAGAGFVDVEEGGSAAAMAEGPWASRVILSHHGAPCEAGALVALLERMRSSRAARLKIVPTATRAGEIGAVQALLSRPRGRAPLAAFAQGRAGAASRALALSWGSWGTYGAAAHGRESGTGQPTTRDLLEVYRAPELSPSTRRFALVGTPVLESPSPAIHAAGYRAAGIDAVYLPFESTDLDDLAVLPVEGLAVTLPLKGAAARRCARLDQFSRWGAVNTVRVEEDGWSGHNTDVPAALSLLSHLLGPSDRVAIVGAGDTARSLAGALGEAGARVTLYARDPARAAASASAAGAEAAALDRLAAASWDVLVQATPLGRAGERVVSAEALRGRAVLDLAYGPGETPLVHDARARGLAAIDGHTFLLEQALLQFALLTGVHPHRTAMAAALDGLGRPA